jgi:hypothetical protein
VADQREVRVRVVVVGLVGLEEVVVRGVPRDRMILVARRILMVPTAVMTVVVRTTPAVPRGRKIRVDHKAAGQGDLVGREEAATLRAARIFSSAAGMSAALAAINSARILACNVPSFRICRALSVRGVRRVRVPPVEHPREVKVAEGVEVVEVVVRKGARVAAGISAAGTNATSAVTSSVRTLDYCAARSGIFLVSSATEDRRVQELLLAIAKEVTAAA